MYGRFQEYETLVTVQFEKRIRKLTVELGRQYCSKELTTGERVYYGVGERFNLLNYTFQGAYWYVYPESLPYCCCS